MYNRVFLCQKSYFRVHKNLGEFVSIVALHDVNEGGILYMGISPRRTRLFTHRPEQEQVRAYTLKYIGLFTFTFTFTFSHLADAFIQSDLQLGVHIYCTQYLGYTCWVTLLGYSYVFWVISTTTKPVGFKFKFQWSIGVTVTDDTVVN